MFPVAIYAMVTYTRSYVGDSYELLQFASVINNSAAGSSSSSFISFGHGSFANVSNTSSGANSSHWMTVDRNSWVTVDDDINDGGAYSNSNIPTPAPKWRNEVS